MSLCGPHICGDCGTSYMHNLKAGETCPFFKARPCGHCKQYDLPLKEPTLPDLGSAPVDFKTRAAGDREED